jgi:hypothetical protein
MTPIASPFAILPDRVISHLQSALWRKSQPFLSDQESQCPLELTGPFANAQFPHGAFSIVKNAHPAHDCAGSGAESV